MIRYRAMIGTVCLIVILLLSTPTPKSIFLGFLFIIAGMFFRGWSSGYINKDKELATEGPYSLTRNPLYFGSFILGCGVVIACNNLIALFTFLAYFSIFFTFLIAIERKRMREKFGAQYDAWAKSANIFIPRLKKIKTANFNISYYMKNKEYRVLYFSLVVIAALIVKYLLQIRKG